MVGKFLSLNPLRLYSDFDSHWVLHNCGLAPNVNYARSLSEIHWNSEDVFHYQTSYFVINQKSYQSINQSNATTTYNNNNDIKNTATTNNTNKILLLLLIMK